MAQSMDNIITFYIVVTLYLSTFSLLCYSEKVNDQEYLQKQRNEVEDSKKSERVRYLLYDINPGEGFNLRRDVYMRVANMVKILNEHENWILVLPPWSRMYHWKSRWLEQSQIRWSSFFDLASLNKHVPVVEFEDFYLNAKDEHDMLSIGQILYLQRYAEGWRDGKWETRADVRPCIDKNMFDKFVEDAEGRWRWSFWGFDDHVTAKAFDCLSTQMDYVDFAPLLINNFTSDILLMHRAEQLMHGVHSEWSPKWWTARRSMRFATHLRQVADDFRRKHLDSNDEKDRTVIDADWTKMKRSHGDALGGPYVAAHLRRRDFLRSHRNDVPSLKSTAEQLESKLKELGLDMLFIATDAPDEEFDELANYLGDYKVFRFSPTEEQLIEYMDGGVAIIDQLICAHARYFIGTSVSTFTFRIHEEREILGFPQEMTYNRLCGDEEPNCEQPAKWKIKYE